MNDSSKLSNSDGADDILILQEQQEKQEFEVKTQTHIDVATQTDLTEYEVYLSEVVTENARKIKKSRTGNREIKA